MILPLLTVKLIIQDMLIKHLKYLVEILIIINLIIKKLLKESLLSKKRIQLMQACCKLKKIKSIDHQVGKRTLQIMHKYINLTILGKILIFKVD
jgi:hypothetical protein